MVTNCNITTFHDAKGNTISVEALIPLFSRKRSDDNRYWIVFSPHVNTFGYSTESEEKALADFERALKVFFDVHFEKGTLEKALIKFGWKKANNTFIKPKLGNGPASSKPTKEFNLTKLANAA